MRDLIIAGIVTIIFGIMMYIKVGQWNKEKDELVDRNSKLESQLMEIKRSNDSLVFFVSKQITDKDKILDNIANKAIILKPKYEYIKDIKPELDDSMLLLNSGAIVNYPLDR